MPGYRNLTSTSFWGIIIAVLKYYFSIYKNSVSLRWAGSLIVGTITFNLLKSIPMNVGSLEKEGLGLGTGLL